ncbi:coat protein [ssRNA phage SRR5466727_6]|uniref:Coat protein n=1 Tax=ssRNA phage SRR5466727_6 TaxID=2786435 RepID=A0A8S5KZM9_9VIRU|nr:coat protein [ssRNA phage SRR5466727_6]DAD50849.1 TPA_asm: coat protein [ssRNA phage SRR5466727_6]
MTLAINAKTYTADSFNKDSVGYAGPNHTVTVSDYAKLARTAPKKTSQSSGVGRTLAKLTRTATLTGALEPTRDMIGEVNFTLPVGAAGADVDTMLNDLGAFVASATFKTHVKSQLVSF